VGIVPLASRSLRPTTVEAVLGGLQSTKGERFPYQMLVGLYLPLNHEPSRAKSNELTLSAIIIYNFNKKRNQELENSIYWTKQ